METKKKTEKKILALVVTFREPAGFQVSGKNWKDSKTTTEMDPTYLIEPICLNATAADFPATAVV
jgi:hypothetical protein